MNVNVVRWFGVIFVIICNVISIEISRGRPVTFVVISMVVVSCIYIYCLFFYKNLDDVKLYLNQIVALCVFLATIHAINGLNSTYTVIVTVIYFCFLFTFYRRHKKRR